jgi:hypothetical protein
VNGPTRGLDVADNAFAVTSPPCPGMVDTEMANVVIADPAVQELLNDIGAHAYAPEESIRRLVQQIDVATQETDHFMGHDWSHIPW